MTSYVPPKKNTELILYVGLVSQADTKTFQANPTIAAGDFKVSTDGGSLTNLATLPAVTPAGSKAVKITLSASEMNGDSVMVVCSDAAGAEWCDLMLSIGTTTNQIDDIRTDTAAILADTGTDGVVVASGSKTGYALASTGIDAILAETDIVAGAGLTNDTGTQLTTINLRQAISAMLSALVGVISGVSSNTPVFKQAAKPAGNTRISAAVTSDGRTAVTLKVPD